MNRNLNSLLGGMAVAAFLIVPTVSGFGQGSAPHGPQPASPQVGGDRAPGHARNFDASSVKIENIVGTVIVDVRNSGPMTLEVSGARTRVDSVHASQHGTRLVVEGSTDTEDDYSVWDWRNWFNFSQGAKQVSGDLTVKVVVPRGADVNVQDLVGNAVIGDTMGALRFTAAASEAHIGKVTRAKVSLGGTGRIDIASVAGELDLDLGGSGKIAAGPAGSVKADIAGSGDAQFGPIAGGLSIDIAGSGNVTAARVNGPTHIDIAGSGSVRIAEGIANPLHVDIMGAGNLYFGGVAIDPHINAIGSGSVHIKAYRGHLDSEGMADVKIGD